MLLLLSTTLTIWFLIAGRNFTPIADLIESTNHDRGGRRTGGAQLEQLMRSFKAKVAVASNLQPGSRPAIKVSVDIGGHFVEKEHRHKAIDIRRTDFFIEPFEEHLSSCVGRYGC